MLAAYLNQRLGLWSSELRCVMAPPAVDYQALPNELTLNLDYGCAEPIDRLVIRYLLFFDIDARHSSIGVIDTGAGRQEFFFDRDFTELEIDIARPAPPDPFLRRLGRMILLGVEHILSGYDHILFLVALLMVNVRFWPLAGIVTAFTIAHSVTLSLAWFGVITLPSRLVESLIALSIVYVAVDNLLGHGFKHRWLLAFGFGLVHGVGFYSVLSDIALARSDMITTLLGFNLGVEAGQLMIVALFFGGLTWVARKPWYERIVKASSIALIAVAGLWFVERAFLSG